MELLLIRHGATEWSEIGRHTGRTDLPLTAHGIAEAERLREVVRAALSGREIDRVLVSPMSRARRTAEIVLPGRAVEVIDELREFDYGDYEGRRRVDIQQERPDWSIWDHGCPRGESIDAASARADRLLKNIEDGAGPVAVVSHGHISRILAARALGLEASAGRIFASATSALSVIKDHHGQRCIYAWNVKALQ
ncbi:histidine phosphatase family protein [Kribbella sp. NPDC056345]|uniref:histidine phosphatase family protein n=1 Tax=Kribbella sp. NPDC056345 TaxID=3345789 RepID=UPI0035DAB473